MYVSKTVDQDQTKSWWSALHYRPLATRFDRSIGGQMD